MFQHLQRVDDEKQQFAAETDVTSADEFQFLFVSFCRPCLEDFEEVLYGLHFWNRSCLRRSFEACVHSDCRAE